MEEEAKIVTKEFIPPVERPSLNGDDLADVCECIVLITQSKNYKKCQKFAAKLQAAADRLKMHEAENIGCGDLLVRLRRNALALVNHQAIAQMVLENCQSNIRDIIDARNAEHKRFVEHVNVLKRNWTLQKRAAQQKERRKKKG